MKKVQAISDLLALAINAETATSPKERHIAKMKAGKVRRLLKSENDASKKYASGVKLSN